MKFLALIAVLLISGCDVRKDFGSADDERAKEVMGWLYSANPEEDFEEAIAAGDLRFKGVYGYSLEVPQVALRCIRNPEEQVAPIEGTTDAIQSYEHRKLNALARVYAEHYNTLLLQYRREHHGFQCGS